MRKPEEENFYLSGEHERKIRKLIFNPRFMDVKIFAEGFAAVELQKTKLMINKPFFVGFTILDLSKLHMYRYILIITLTFPH